MILRDIVFWILFALLLPQALWVRKTAARFPAAEGGPKGAIGRGPPAFRLLAIGDSIIAGVGSRTLDDALVGRAATHLSGQLDCRVEWTAAGRSGATTGQVATRLLPGLESMPADAVLVSAGVNDVISLHGLRRWEKDLRALLAALASHWPNAVIAFSGLPPMNHFPVLPRPLRALFGLRARQFDRVLSGVLAEHPRAVHIPLDFEARPGGFCGDGFHPSEQSYGEFGIMAAGAIVCGLRSDRRAKPGTADSA